ncbi:pygopus homolog 1 isoform X2 [Bombina bombina]|uniref:pygopus homolog 1 isoform X2 n=1 Tax=Bombina bombina TaxID=8345 RepID=UPI00235A5DAB|nr:pygopus homolog 1 isoform X2 [Bombina bombina]
MDKALWDTAGDESDFDGLVRPVVLLGSPDKKKRRSSTQGISFSSQSEYAPPTNTSSDVLIASNPFDDEYTISPPFGNPYFHKTGYSAVRNYTFRMPTSMPHRMVSQFSGSYTFRNQSPSFPEDRMAMTFGKPRLFNTGLQNNINYDKELFTNRSGQTITLPGQHFRTNRQDFSTMTAHNSMPIYNFETISNKGMGMESSNPYTDSKNHFLHTRISTSRADFSPEFYKNANQSSTPHTVSDGIINFSSEANPKSRKKQLIGTENVQPKIDQLVNGGHTNGTRKRQAPRVAKDDVTANEKCNRWLLNSSYSSSLPCNTLYSCAVCTNDIHDVQDAVRCEASCLKWFHRSCTGMTETAYALLTAESSAIWVCDSCFSTKDIQLLRTSKNIS